MHVSIPTTLTALLVGLSKYAKTLFWYSYPNQQTVSKTVLKFFGGKTRYIDIWVVGIPIFKRI